MSLTFGLGSVVASAQEVIRFPVSPLTIVSANGRHDFVVEVADTPERRRRGLMFRENVPPGTGMIFDFQELRPVGMWMKNTPSSLDMLFLAEDGTIRHIYERTVPFSETVLASPVSVLAVLELRAGTVEELGIALGDQVEHAIFAK